MGQLDGKIAIVTGATSGIGERIAEVFVAEGARVIAAGRRTDQGEALAARCGEALSFVRADVSKEVDVKAMIDHAVTRFGRLDCLVNNAGSGAPMVSIADVTEEQLGRAALSPSPASRACGRARPVMFIAARKRRRSISHVRRRRNSASAAFAPTVFPLAASSLAFSPRPLESVAPMPIGYSA
jgi:hypothetical protein